MDVDYDKHSFIRTSHLSGLEFIVPSSSDNRSCTMKKVSIYFFEVIQVTPFIFHNKVQLHNIVVQIAHICYSLVFFLYVVVYYDSNLSLVL